MNPPGVETIVARDQPEADRLSGRALLSYVVLAAALIAGVTTVILRAKWPVLTPEEAEHVGLWYGYINEGERHYCWLAELERDRTCRISFRNFYAVEDDDGNVLPDRYESGDVDESRGTWEINGSDYTTHTWYPENDPGTVARVFVWLSEQRWLPRGKVTYTYQVDDASADHFVYTLASEGVTYRAVRVTPGFELPDQPLDHAAALAWWEQRRPPESESAGSPP